MIEKVNVAQKLHLINDHWNPKIAGQLNGQHVKLAKFQGEFIWHSHEYEDELFYVLHGSFTMELRDRSIDINTGEFIIIPKGVEHRPVAPNEVHVMLFEPAGTLNTGNAISDLTRNTLDLI